MSELAITILIIFGAIFSIVRLSYWAFINPMKETFEHDKKIDSEKVPDGIIARSY